jgi:hypothetical protein
VQHQEGFGSQLIDSLARHAKRFDLRHHVQGQVPALVSEHEVALFRPSHVNPNGNAKEIQREIQIFPVFARKRTTLL